MNEFFLTEEVIYEKIRSNETPYWVLYLHNGIVRNSTPIDVFDPDALNKDLSKDEKIEQSINKLRNELTLYKQNLEPGRAIFFHIITKRSKSSNGESATFSYNFKVQRMSDVAAGLSGIPSLAGFRSPEELDQYINKKMELTVEFMRLENKKKELERMDELLKEREKELDKESTALKRGFKKAIIEVAETLGWIDGETSATSKTLAGTYDDDPKYQHINQLAEHLYKTYELDDLKYLTTDVLDIFIKKMKQTQTTQPQSSNAQSQ